MDQQMEVHQKLYLPSAKVLVAYTMDRIITLLYISSSIIMGRISINNNYGRLLVLLVFIAISCWRLHNALTNEYNEEHSSAASIDSPLLYHSNNNNNRGNNIVTPEEAAQRLQNKTWYNNLQTKHLENKLSNILLPWRRHRRIIEWSVATPENEKNAANDDDGIELFLLPFAPRSSELIDLLLYGKVVAAMGENVVILGYAKIALALGVKRVVLFESEIDFIDYIDATKQQMYILDYLSLNNSTLTWDALMMSNSKGDDHDTELKLKQRTWQFGYWGANEAMLEEFGMTGFPTDHVLVPFNYTNYAARCPMENVRMGILPTAVTMNHVASSGASASGTTKQSEQKKGRIKGGGKNEQQQHCNAFFMGKTVEQVEELKPLIKLIEEKLHQHNNNTTSTAISNNVTLCTGMKLPQGTTLGEYLGFPVQYTINLGRTRPEIFANIVGSANVVIGSGIPAASPTIIDTISGGGIFMAPSKQFIDMEDHPLFVKSDVVFTSVEEQADEIVRLVLDTSERKPFGGYTNTSYNIVSVCRQMLKVIVASNNNDVA